MIWVLLIIVASPGVITGSSVVTGSWGPPTEIGEYLTKEDCMAAITDAVAFNIAKKQWLPYDSGAICIPRKNRYPR